MTEMVRHIHLELAASVVQVRNSELIPHHTPLQYHGRPCHRSPTSSKPKEQGSMQISDSDPFVRLHQTTTATARSTFQSAPLRRPGDKIHTSTHPTSRSTKTIIFPALHSPSTKTPCLAKPTLPTSQLQPSKPPLLPLETGMPIPSPPPVSLATPTIPRSTTSASGVRAIATSEESNQ